MRDATDFYFDNVTQIHMPKMSSGRIVLLGDAAYAPSLASGQGTSMALVGAYVLAGELYQALGDHKKAFAAYDTEMKSFIKKNQKLGENVKQLVPASTLALKFQLMMIRLMPYIPFGGTIIKKIREEVRDAAYGITIRNYGT